jgi:hypothetical protein
MLFSVTGYSHHLQIKEQPATEAMRAVAARLIPEFAANSTIRRRIEKAKKGGRRAF